MTIKRKLFLAILISGIILTIIGVSLTYTIHHKHLENEVRYHLETIVQEKSNEIELFARMMRGRMTDFSSDGKIKDCLHDFQNPSEDSCTQPQLTDHLIRNKLPIFTELTQVIVIDNQGTIVSSTDQPQIGTDASTAPYFVQAHEAPTLISPYRQDDQIHLYVSAPIIRQDQKVGIISGKIKISELFSFLKQQSGLGNRAKTLLLDQDQNIIFSSDLSLEKLLQDKFSEMPSHICNHAPQDSDSLHHDLSSHHHEDFHTNGNTVFRSSGHVDSMNWCFIAEITESDAIPVIRDILKFTFFFTAALIAIVFIMAHLIAKVISTPIIQLKKGAEKIAQGDLTHTVSTNSKDEIGELSRTFDRMKESIQNSYQEVEEKVTQQTKQIEASKAQLEEKLQELEQTNDIMMGREVRIVELKEKIEQLEKKIQNSS